MFIDYNNFILNYIASIRKKYGLSSSYEENQEFLNVVKKYKQIILVLIDGMGSRLIEKQLEKQDFLYKNMKKEIFTVFPPTTTAATTSILNGKTPNENCWLGWFQYMKSENAHIIPFLSYGYYDDKHYAGFSMQEKYPVKNIIDELNEKNINATKIMPFFDKQYGVKDFESFCQKIISESENQENEFVYAYWDEYDSLMHKLGPSDIEVKNLLKYINDSLEKVANNLNKETLMVVIADHGQVDVYEEELLKTDLVKYFSKLPDFEPRALNFHIKEEFKNEFRKEFIQKYENEYILLTKEEAIETKLFGSSDNHSDFKNLLGDFIAIAKGKLHFKLTERDFTFKGAHAGCHIDELMIPLIIYGKKDA